MDCAPGVLALFRGRSVTNRRMHLELLYHGGFFSWKHVHDQILMLPFSNQLASHHHPGVLHGATVRPADDQAQHPWQKVLRHFSELEKPKTVAETLQVGRWREQANAAITLWEATKLDPATNLPKLALALQTLSIDISSLSRVEDGLILQREACTIFRTLTKQGLTENQTLLIQALCRECDLATTMKLPQDAFKAITEAVDFRCAKESYAFQTVDALRDCLLQLDTCVSALELWADGSDYLKAKIKSLRASVRGLDAATDKPLFKDSRELMALQSSVRGGDGRKKLHKPGKLSGSPSAFGDSSTGFGGTTLSWDTESSTRAGSVLGGRSTTLSRQTTGSSTAYSASTLGFGSVTNVANLVGDHNILEFVQMIGFALHLLGSYLRKLERLEESCQTFIEATQVYSKITKQQIQMYRFYLTSINKGSKSTYPSRASSVTPAPPPSADVAAALYSLASELFEIRHLDGSRTAAEEGFKAYTILITISRDLYYEPMARCRQLLDGVQAAIKARDKDLKAKGLGALIPHKADPEPEDSTFYDVNARTNNVLQKQRSQVVAPSVQRNPDPPQGLRLPYGLDLPSGGRRSSEAARYRDHIVTSRGIPTAAQDRPTSRRSFGDDSLRMTEEGVSLLRSPSNAMSIRQRQREDLDRDREHQLETRFSRRSLSDDRPRYPRGLAPDGSRRTTSDGEVRRPVQVADPIQRFNQRLSAPRSPDAQLSRPSSRTGSQSNVPVVQISDADGARQPHDDDSIQDPEMTPARRAAQLRNIGNIDRRNTDRAVASGTSTQGVATPRSATPSSTSNAIARSGRSSPQPPRRMSNVEEDEETQSSSPVRATESSRNGERVADATTSRRRRVGHSESARRPNSAVYADRRENVLHGRRASMPVYNRALPDLPTAGGWGVPPVAAPPRTAPGVFGRFYRWIIGS